MGGAAARPISGLPVSVSVSVPSVSSAVTLTHLCNGSLATGFRATAPCERLNTPIFRIYIHLEHPPPGPICTRRHGGSFPTVMAHFKAFCLSTQLTSKHTTGRCAAAQPINAQPRRLAPGSLHSEYSRPIFPILLSPRIPPPPPGVGSRIQSIFWLFRIRADVVNWCCSAFLRCSRSPPPHLTSSLPPHAPRCAHDRTALTCMFQVRR